MSVNKPNIPPLNLLIQGCIKRDRQMQEQLYLLLAPKLFVVCLRYSNSKEDAEEILQEAFLKILGNIEQFKAQGSFEGWARKITVNCALQRYRSKTPLYALPHGSIENLQLETNEMATSNIATKELLEMINKLSPIYKMVFNLYVFEGMKHKEIADLLNIAEGTSKSNLSDARKILQNMILKKNKTIATNINYL